MRFIDQDRVEELLPSNWREIVTSAKAYVFQKVEEARNEAEVAGKSPDQVRQAVKRARNKAINTKSYVWRAFGESVKSLSSEKCWYCESLEDRSYMPVDHFRPKSCVNECPDHDGYWWLAFEWTNYRYCCIYCNSHTTGKNSSGGKQDHFPLVNAPNWVKEENGDLHTEEPMLVDPCDPADPNLITFHETGFPREVVRDEQSVKYKRANKSIEIYHLHHNKSVKTRKRLAILIRNLVGEIETLQVGQFEGVDTSHQIKARMKDLTKLIHEDAPYRTAARLYLKGNINETNCSWIQELLDRN
jgi:uncharacterized protein (TIGR02646 family)